MIPLLQYWSLKSLKTKKFFMIIWWWNLTNQTCIGLLGKSGINQWEAIFNYIYLIYCILRYFWKNINEFDYMLLLQIPLMFYLTYTLHIVLSC